MRSPIRCQFLSGCTPWATVLALILSFIAVSVLAFCRLSSGVYLSATTPADPVSCTPKRKFARGIDVACLSLYIASGFFGTCGAFDNFNMTFFWDVFVIGGFYLANQSFGHAGGLPLRVLVDGPRRLVQRDAAQD